jgi:hypothetical protein
MAVFLDPNSYLFAQQLFIRLLGLCYFLAFWSLSKQVVGLYGSQGIIPAQQTLHAFEKNGKSAYWRIPTIFWLNASDSALKYVAIFGEVISLLVLWGIVPALWLPLLWFAYLSFVNIGIVFLGFQWDTLLLEVGFVAIFFALQSPPPLLLLFALWLLLFRFMFASGIVKLLSGCPEWRILKALRYHYETQPLPNRMAYYFHQQTNWLSKASEIGMFFVELIVPFFIFGTDQMRTIACLLLIGLQLLIILTGNYAFFNVLTIALCVTLLDNAHLQWLFGAVPVEAPLPNMMINDALNGIGAILIVLNLLQLLATLTPYRFIYRILNAMGAYYIVNAYGLFARMTTQRNEIEIEGSDDGQNWKVYAFKWKPGDLFNPPKQVAPYHPRLDWQMWFAALGSYHSNAWFVNFLVRLLEGSKPVEGLLQDNPFPDAPPRFIRSLLYEYHFSDLKTKAATGQWWVRKLKGAYTPVMKLSEHAEREI